MNVLALKRRTTLKKERNLKSKEQNKEKRTLRFLENKNEYLDIVIIEYIKIINYAN